MPQALAQGRSILLIAPYGQALAHMPHLTHLDWSITLRPCTIEMAPFGQTSVQGWARQPWHMSVT